MITLQTPAKINLTLEVLEKRPDGYHEIRSVMQAVGLCDTLTFEPSVEITFASDAPGWAAEKSLVTKAAELLKNAAGCGKGTAVQIEKRIPLVAGLGGDSSDAAAVLRGLNELWELDLPPEKLQELAAQLGSDVTFFLDGGTALAEGRGEVLTPLPSPAGLWAVIVMPNMLRVQGKTARLYGGLKSNHFTDGGITKKLVEALRTGAPFDDALLFNTFENVLAASYSKCTLYMEHIIKLGAPHVHVCGSGPALYTLYEDKTRAEELREQCKEQGMEAYVAGVGECEDGG